MTITLPSIDTLSKGFRKRQDGPLEQLQHIPELDIPLGIHVLAQVAVAETVITPSEQDDDDTIKLTFDDMAEYLTTRIEDDTKKKKPSEELGLFAVHEAIIISLEKPKNKKLQTLASTALKSFKGVAKPTLEAAYNKALTDKLPFYEALDEVNDQRKVS